MTQPTRDNLVPPHAEGRHSRAACLVATAAMLTLLVLPGFFHMRHGVRASDFRRWAQFFRDEPAAQAMRDVDADFDRRFLPRYVMLNLAAQVPALAARTGERVQRGTGGFFFLTQDTRICTAAGFLNPRFPNPTNAARELGDMADQLRRRGIHLIVLPIPAKASIYPDRLFPDYDASQGPFLNLDHAAWFARVRDLGVDVIDLTDVYWSHRNDPPAPLYYVSDTHWSDPGRRLAAAALAPHVVPLIPAPTTRPFHTRPYDHKGPADLDADFDDEQPSTATEHVTQLYDDDGLFIPGDEAPVLVLGDSSAGIDVTHGFGIAQRLTELTGIPVQTESISGGSANVTRQDLADRPELLKGKRVVIYLFVLRHIVYDEWNPVRLPAP